MFSWSRLGAGTIQLKKKKKCVRTLSNCRFRENDDARVHSSTTVDTTYGRVSKKSDRDQFTVVWRITETTTCEESFKRWPFLRI